MSVLQSTRPGNLRLVAEDGQTVPVQPVPSSGAGGNTFVFRPGGVAGGNVYTDWPTMMLLVGQLTGPKFIEVDSSIATATVPAGSWNVNDCTITGAAFNAPTLNFASGALLKFQVLTVAGLVILQAGPTAPIQTQGVSSQLTLYNGGTIFGSAAAPFVQVSSADLFIIQAFVSATIGEGANQCVTVLAGGTCNIVALNESSINDHALGGAVPVNLEQDANTFVSGIQATAPSTVHADLAKLVQYVPAVLANWSGTAPTSVANALDRIAAKITPIP